ncbi:MAG: PRC-barrel domain-containing protein [Candidatus Bathyarchaeia archaeon]|jgi:sporulation protein YlmC with PRC-barrel domain
MINFESLMGLKVITSQAFTLGVVKGAQVDKETWKITHLKVKLEEEAANKLGVKKRFRSSIVCLAVESVKAVGDFISIGKSLDELKASNEIIECEE